MVTKYHEIKNPHPLSKMGAELNQIVNCGGGLLWQKLRRSPLKQYKSMSYLAERQEKREKQRLESLGKSSIKRDEFLATLSNPDSNIDELGNAIRWFFLPIATIWVGYIGYIFALKELEGVVEPWQATLLAIALPCFVQVVKVYAATKGLRAFHFKWYDRSAHDMWFWSGVGLLVVVMFGWSLKISIWDIKDTSSEKYIAQNSDSLSVMLSNATAPIDAQILALNSENAQAGTMKTKRGKIAWSGQQIKMNNATTLSSLNEQKRAISEQVLADYGDKKKMVSKSASHRGNFFQRFGGFGEALEIIMLLLLGLVEAINRNQNAERLSKPDNQAHINKIDPNPLAEFQRNAQNLTNQGTTPMQFRWEGYGEPNTPPTTVTHNPPPVSQLSQPSPTVLGSNQILLQLRTKLMADIPNLVKRNGIPSTVSSRINLAFDECGKAMAHPDFKPTREVGAKVYGYLCEAITQLNEAGWPYERDVFFMKHLLTVIPKEQEQEV